MKKGQKELTAASVIIGVLLAVIFGAANAYLGLRAGMTSFSINSRGSSFNGDYAFFITEKIIFGNKHCADYRFSR